jgi:L-amino acid N-acyltransferase YncA
MAFSIRKATQSDAGAILAILEEIAAAGVYTAISRPWTADQQRRYLASLSPREAVHMAETQQGEIIGYQTLDLWAPTLESMAHVGQVGTFIRPDWRRQGVGESLFRCTVDFAREYDFQKFVIQVRASNSGALRFYQRMGFRQCGRLSRQVKIGDQEDDEVIMEYFLDP